MVVVEGYGIYVQVQWKFQKDEKVPTYIYSCDLEMKMGMRVDGSKLNLSLERRMPLEFLNI